MVICRLDDVAFGGESGHFPLNAVKVSCLCCDAIRTLSDFIAGCAFHIFKFFIFLNLDIFKS